MDIGGVADAVLAVETAVVTEVVVGGGAVVDAVTDRVFDDDVVLLYVVVFVVALPQVIDVTFDVRAVVAVAVASKGMLKFGAVVTVEIIVPSTASTVLKSILTVEVFSSFIFFFF